MAEALVLFFERLELADLIKAFDEHLVQKRLLDVVEGTGAHRFDRLLDGRIAGDHDDFGLGRRALAALRIETPSSPGSRTSVITQSKTDSRIAAIAAAPVPSQRT